MDELRSYIDDVVGTTYELVANDGRYTVSIAMPKNYGKKPIHNLPEPRATKPLKRNVRDLLRKRYAYLQKYSPSLLEARLLRELA